MNAKQWFISAGVSAGIWLVGMGQVWVGGYNASGWEVLFRSPPEGYELMRAFALAISLALGGFAAFAIYKAFSVLNSESKPKGNEPHQGEL
jgi:hypothetical protein